MNEFSEKNLLFSEIANTSCFSTLNQNKKRFPRHYLNFADGQDRGFSYSCTANKFEYNIIYKILHVLV